MKQTAENIEGEAAVIRSQLVAVGADIRHRADPAVIVDAAKASFRRRTEDAPAFLKKNASPILLVVLGGALGAAATGLFSPSRRLSSVAPKEVENASLNASLSAVEARPSAGPQVKAALLSAVGMGLGYLAGMFVPHSPTEERLLSEPKALLRGYADEFLDEHMRGMKLAAANLFGASRLSGTALIGLAMLAEALGTPPKRSKIEAL